MCHQGRLLPLYGDSCAYCTCINIRSSYMARSTQERVDKYDKILVTKFLIVPTLNYIYCNCHSFYSICYAKSTYVTSGYTQNLMMPCSCSRHFIVMINRYLYNIIIITMVAYKQCVQQLVRGYNVV